MEGLIVISVFLFVLSVLFLLALPFIYIVAVVVAGTVVVSMEHQGLIEKDNYWSLRYRWTPWAGSLYRKRGRSHLKTRPRT